MNSPSAPQNEISSPTSLRSRLKALTLVAALFSILAIYLGALIASALTAIGLTGQFIIGTPGIFEAMAMAIGIGAASLLTFVLAKGLFRRAELNTDEFVEITADAEPEFFEFLRDACARCDAPMPDGVFVFPDVNAGVFVEASLLRLFRPAKKHLLVGLGMVNTLNRTELEAVLAHEFGHFSQRTLGLHHYVQAINGVLDEVIHGRNAIDRAMIRWQNTRLRGLGIPRLVMAATEMVRRICSFLQKMLRNLEASVSRQMELHADSVAVELTGSDALIHALVRTDWADRCFSQTLYDLERAAEEGMRSDDLYFHQSHLSELMRRRLDDPSLGIPPELPDDETRYHRAFGGGDDSDSLPRAELWESHPPHELREYAARHDYQRSEFDERSAWTFFADPDALRALMTDQLYAHRIPTSANIQPAEAVQRHLDGEHAEVLLNADDRAVYGHRFIEPGDLEEAISSALSLDIDDNDLRRQIQRVTGPERSEAARRIEGQIAAVQATPQAPPSAPAHALRSPTTPPSVAVSGTTAEADREWLSDWDRRLLITTLCAADKAGTDVVEELAARYRFHLHLQDLVRWLRQHSQFLVQIITTLQEGRELDEETVDSIFSTLSALYDGLDRGLNGAPDIPEMHGLPPTDSLSMLVLEGALIDRKYLDEGRLDDTWLGHFIEQWQQASQRIDHLRRKSLGALLLYQKQVLAPWC